MLAEATDQQVVRMSDLLEGRKCFYFFRCRDDGQCTHVTNIVVGDAAAPKDMEIRSGCAARASPLPHSVQLLVPTDNVSQVLPADRRQVVIAQPNNASTSDQIRSEVQIRMPYSIAVSWGANRRC
jgi:hypothetical protein